MTPERARPDGDAFLANLLAFARLLRAAGIAWTLPQLETLLAALALVGLHERALVRDAARACLVGHRDQQPLFDQLFDAIFRREVFAAPSPLPMGSQLARELRREARQALAAGEAPPESRPEIEVEVLERSYQASSFEALRLKDFARLTDEERAEVASLLARHPWQLPPRRSRRRRRNQHGQVDLRLTLRAALRRGGEPAELLRAARREVARPLVALCDISGSMEVYARIFLPFLYSLRAASRRVETFVFATRLTRITRELQGRQPDEALRRAAAASRDWGGGTRIGECLRTFNFEWARRVLGRGAVVLVLSDGWDRGEKGLLGQEVARLRRHCHRLYWLNPLLGGEGYQPIAPGIRAILPHVDHFLPVHNLQSLRDLAERLAEST